MYSVPSSATHVALSDQGFGLFMLCPYQSHRLAQHEDDILIHDHSGVGKEEVGGGEVEEGEGADHSPGRYEAHFCQERDYLSSLPICVDTKSPHNPQAVFRKHKLLA